MTSPSRATDESDLDALYPQIAWRRYEHSIVNRFTVQHRFYDDGSEEPGRTLCGTQIRWEKVTAGDTRRCDRCDRKAQRLVNARTTKDRS
jgi:hypothetical protein